MSFPFKCRIRGFSITETKRFLLVCGVVLGTCLMIANSSASSVQPTVIRIGVTAALTADGRPTGVLAKLATRYLNEQLGPGGPKVIWVGMASAGPGINEAWASGSIDFAYYGDFPAIVGLAGGLKVKLIEPGVRGNDSYLIVPAKSAAKSIDDLRGSRLAIHKGRPWNLAFARLLLANHLEETDFQIFDLNPVDGDAALAAHNIDALYGSDGYLLEERGVGKIIWSTHHEPLDWKSTAELWVTDSFARQYPELTEKVAKAYVLVAYYISIPDHRDEILHASVTAGLPYDAVLKQYQGTPLKDHWVPVFDPFIVAHYRNSIAYALKAKLIRRDVPVEEFIDERFSQAALRELKLEHYWTPMDAQGEPIGSGTIAAPQRSLAN
jgi:sulfonate transport system substrate-binding protein